MRLKPLALMAWIAGSFAMVLPTAQSADFIITAVVRDFPMKADEPKIKDYYINAGSNNGLRKGAFIDAIRRLPIYDNINAKLLGDTQIRIAKLKIVHVDKNVSIARLVKVYEKQKEEVPLTGIDDVMIGDLIEVSQKQ